MFLLLIPKDANPKDLEKFKEFGETLKEHDTLRPDLWKTIITLQSTLLALSLGLKQYSSSSINILLLITWSLEIFTIILGLLLIYNRIEILTKAAINSYKSYLDTREIDRVDANGKYIHNEEKRKGMHIAVVLYSTPKEGHIILKPKAYELAEQYKKFLPSLEYFKDLKKHKILEYFIENQNNLIAVFYVFTVISFLCLFLDVTYKEYLLPFLHCIHNFLLSCH